MEQGNFLGVDWGKRKIGLALAHPETRVAVAYGTAINDDQFLKQLAQIIDRETVTTVIIGIPQYQHVTKHPAEHFGDTVRQLGVQVEFSNEMFTSKLAQGNLTLQGYRQVSHQDDAEAAKILLQGWLDRKG